MRQGHCRFRGFTIVELLVVVSIIALLIGILLPALGKARDQARITISLGNLRQLGQAHAVYSNDWSDQQFTLVRGDISRYGNTPGSALLQFESSMQRSHPPIILGWAHGPQGDDASALWGFYLSNSLNYDLIMPVTFGEREDPRGWMRMVNVQAFNQYLTGRFYDPIFYAPKDEMATEAIEPCANTPDEFCVIDGSTIWWSSYCMSPAALYNPDVMASPLRERADGTRGWRNPWHVASGFRTPSSSQARHPTLKTHMLEHNWLQNRRQHCNPSFIGGMYDGCEPYYFNHAAESFPMTLFYDGHVAGLSFREAYLDDLQAQVDAGPGGGLWSRDTGMGVGGYYPLDSYDVGFAPDSGESSFHILTTDGILGRDKLANR